MVEFLRATVDQIAASASDMMLRDIAEMVPWDVELDPDIEFYKAIEKLGKFRGYLAFDGEKAIGYAWFFVNKHRHFKDHVWAIVDDYWLDPSYRRARIAKRFFEYIESDLFSIPEVTAVKLAYRDGHPAAQRLFLSMGYLPLDTSCVKMRKKNA